MSFTSNFRGTDKTGGTPPESITKLEGEKLILPGHGDLIKKAHYFNGWRLEDYQNFEGKISPYKQDFIAGDEIEFLSQGLVDADGNAYTTVIIGNQEWVVENWRSTKYADGTGIPNVTDGTNWSNLTTPAYCWYNNDSAQGYGALYNWWVVDPANTKQIAPNGWRVSTNEDWDALADHLGGSSVAGGKMKTTGTSDWSSPNTGATNESGFSGLPGGGRNNNGNFLNVGNDGYWWSATVLNASGAWFLHLHRNNENLGMIDNYKGWGFSVRLVRDVE